MLWQRVLGGEGAAPRVPMPLQVTHGTPLLLLQLVASSLTPTLILTLTLTYILTFTLILALTLILILGQCRSTRRSS